MAMVYAGDIHWRPTGGHDNFLKHSDLEVSPRRSKLPVIHLIPFNGHGDCAQLWMPTQKSTKRRTPIVVLQLEVTFPRGRPQQHKPLIHIPLDKIDQWQHIPVALVPDARIYPHDLAPLLVRVDEMMERWVPPQPAPTSPRGMNREAFNLGAFYAENWEEEVPPGAPSLDEIVDGILIGIERVPNYFLAGRVQQLAMLSAQEIFDGAIREGQFHDAVAELAEKYGSGGDPDSPIYDKCYSAAVDGFLQTLVFQIVGAVLVMNPPGA
jgi:hypothetical protein